MKIGPEILLLLGVWSFPGSALAQSCTTETFKGTYIFSNSGFVVTNGGVPISFYASIGRIVVNGDGNLQVDDTASTNGQIERRSYVGTYQLHENCTGAVQFRTGSVNGEADIVVSPDGKEFHFIQTDPGVVVSGTAKRQDSGSTGRANGAGTER